MSNDRGRYRSEPADIIARMVDMETRLSRLERTPSIDNTSIDKGSLRVKDASGSVRVQVGLLSDNTNYGVEVKETGQDIFHQVPYVFSLSVATFQGTTSTTFTDLATPGPALNVPIRTTGRALVLIHSQVQWAANAASAGPITQGGWCSVALTGANTRTAASMSTDLLAMDVIVWVATGAESNTATHSPSSATVLTGLTPGDTTFTMKYAMASGAANAAEFGRRCLTVIAL
jgi:hypothetical protein